MSTLKTGALRGTSGTADSLQLHASNQSVTFPGDLIATKQNGCERIILEQFFTPCDGSVIATSAGNVTVQDVTAIQDGTETYADLTGSVISYTPPTGTTQVIYEFYYQVGRHSNTGSHLCKLYLDSDEVTQGFTQYHGGLAIRSSIKWGFNIGGSADTTAGRVASWSSAKTIKIQTREYGSTTQTKMHSTIQSSDVTSTDQFVTPCIGITAIG